MILDVVAVISNPCRFKSRYQLYREFEQRMLANPLVRLTTVELAYGERPHEVTDSRHIQLRTEHELWHKENLINIGISRLPSDAKYVAWIDADISFVRDDWAEETIHQLQHHQVIQLFSHAIDLGPERETLHVHRSFMYCYHEKMSGSKTYCHWHPGYAWAARRETLNQLGGLMDHAILGSGDHQMATALIGKGKGSIHHGVTDTYKARCAAWEARATQHVRKDVGYVPGTILHYWHGRKKDRRYRERWDVLTENQFCPDRDVWKDSQGLWRLNPDSIGLRDGIRAYFRARAEDANTTG